MTDTDFGFGLGPQELAETASAHMFAADNASQALGMTIDAIGPGSATLSMTVTDHMVNGFKIMHGGLTFSLADSAFAFACNARNMASVAAGCEITFTAPARLGDRLTAHCTERFLKGRNGVYDVTVENQNGETVALFRGKSRAIGQPVWRPDAEADAGP